MEKYHFIAIGGIGMSGLAKYLLELGYEVSGSDIVNSKYMDKLAKRGAKIYIGHSENNLSDVCKVVVSSVIKDDNPELKKAKELNLPILHRSDLLKELSEKGQYFIGYSGTHGKTTTSGLASYVLEKAELNPSFVVGGIVPEINTNAQFNNGKYFVAELDESDGTIVKYIPDILVVNNLEVDHVDFYTEGVNSLVKTFNQVISNLKPTSKIFINSSCKISKELKFDNILTFGFQNADYVAENVEVLDGKTSFKILKNGEFLTNLKIQLLGEHNILNALVVLASLNEAGVGLEVVKPHFETFTGMGRRFQYIGKAKGALIYDDYAHHPTEVKATVNALKTFKNKNSVVVFQPHRYTRLQFFWEDFLNAFEGVKEVVLTDVYSASEPEINGVNSKKFANELAEKSSIKCRYIEGSMKEVAKALFTGLSKDDVVVGMGAGTITELSKELVNLGKGV